jgi:hypothetical protein
MRYISEVQPKVGNPYFYVRVPWKDRAKNWRCKTFLYASDEEREEALSAARAFRDDHLLAEFGTTKFPDRHTGHKKNAGKNSKSGIVGVSRTVDSKTGLAYWVASWREGPAGSRKTANKTFAVNVYGEQEAFRLACEMREKKVEEHSMQFTERLG